jgi:hypothetical protein
MSPYPRRGWFSRATAAVVSFALVASALAPGAAAAAEIVSAPDEFRAASPALAGFAGSAPTPLTAPSLALLAGGPALSAPAAFLTGAPALPDGRARAVADAASPTPLPAAVVALSAAPSAVPAPAAAPAASSPLTRLAAWLGAEPARAHAGAASAKTPPAAAAAETPDAAKARADDEFRRLTGEAAAPERAGLPETAAGVSSAAAAPLARGRRGSSAALPISTPPPSPAAAAAAEGAPAKSLHEDFLGFRTVRGIVRDPALGRLPSDAATPRIIDQISGQFGLARKDVVELARGFGLKETDPRESWLAVYDRLQSVNRDHFKRLDSRKYHGSGSFRELANLSYAPGWRGTLQRGLELHKLLIGCAVRFPYHLFDMFLFGYFRQAISFEFFHSSEDFFAFAPEKGLARKWLEASLRGVAVRGPGLTGGLRARAWFRGLERWFLTPLAKPLATFIVRRLTLAIMSAVAMGLLGAFAPILPLSFALTAIPYLGPAVVWALNGLPVVVAAVPFVGHFFAPVVAAAAGALAKDLVLGPLLNTLILSTLLTYPASAREFVARVQDRHPLARLTPSELLGALGRAAISRDFWGANFKSFLGLATVGAEISGILTYASGIDGTIDRAYFPATGHHFSLIHGIGAAVDAPKGESPIPFGGAITWGNVLLYKLQDLTGVHISDAVMGAAVSVKTMAGFEDATHAGMVKTTAAAVVQAAEARPGAKTPFDPDLWKKPQADVVARIKELADGGGIEAELAAVKGRMQDLRGKLSDAQARLDAQRAQSRPITPAEQAEYDSLLKQLSAKRDESYALAKLAEKANLAAPTPDGLAELRRLKSLQDFYGPLLPPPPTDKDASLDAAVARAAAEKALVARIDQLVNGVPGAAPSETGPVPMLSKEKRDAIEKLVSEIEQGRAEVKGEISEREAAQALLAAANKIRNHALAERRNGSGMMRFHTDFAKLDTVVDLALSLNEIAAAEAAIAKMQNLLQTNTAAINAANQQNQQNLAANNALAAQQAQWQQQAQQAVSLDQASQQSLAGQQTEASTAVSDIGSFQTTINNFLAQVNAQDKGQSANAMAEYQRRLALLPQAAQWATTGNPNNPSAFSLSSFQADLTEVQGALTQAQAGLAKIPTVPVEFAGVLVVAIPGAAPGQQTVTVTNPSKAEVLQILGQYKTGWQAELATKQSFLTQVNQMMDPNYAGTTTDVFGNVTPVSLPRWLAQTQQDLGTKQSTAKQLLSQLDQTAAQINAAAGSNIPMLSGMSLTQLQTAIQNYGTTLEAVQFPNNGTVATFQAKMALITAAQNVPLAARAIVQWSQDQATVTAIQSAMSTTLPQVQQSLQSLVNMVNAILADNQADVNFVNTGQNGGQTLIDRKTALLQGTIIPALQQAQTMLTGTLIPYQQSSIASYASNSNGSYYTLYTAEENLLTQTNSLYNTTIPWAIVTQGAPTGNTGAALANIASFKQTFVNYMNGYTDSAGVHEGITQYQQDMKDRQCASGCTRTESVYGETQPYSLPMKISQYGAEMTQRATQINTEDAQINQILAQIQTLSNGQYNLQSYMLPTGVGTDAGSVARVQAIVNASLVPNLGTQLQTIAKAAQAAAGSTSITVGTGSGGTVPVGKQPSPTISTNQQIAILALNAAQRLVPSSIAQPAGAPASYAIARYLYSNSVVTASQSALTTQVPQAVAFLTVAAKSLNDAIADCGIDVSYVNSNGTNATPAAVYARKVAIFGELNSFLQQAVSFYAMKTGWDQQSFSTINSVNTYYSSLSTIYANGSTVDQSELTEMNTMSQALATTLSGLQATQAKVLSWMSQLDPQQQSALRNVADDVSKLQDQTRAVLDANINWHQLDDDLQRSQRIVSADLTQVDAKQQKLAALLSDPAVQGSLPPDLVRRIEALRVSQNAWSLGGPGDQTQAIVVKKSDFSSFLDAMLGMITHNAPGTSDQDLSSLKSSLLANPQGLSSFIPGASIMQFGDNADGFYLVYQSNFSVPNGLQTGTWVTLGNVAHAWGNNISVNSYEFTSPPSSGGQNAPYGDKGVELQVESLQGENWVNYLNVDLHRFGFDIPTNDTVGSTLSPSRLMIFDDYAVMLLNNRLYVGLAGYGDAAASQTAQNPYFYGGNVQTSFKLNDVMSLDAKQQALFIQDPRSFLETVNLDFTGYDPNLNQDFVVSAKGDDKYYSRTQVGPTFDVNRLLNPNGGGDSFTVSLFAADTRGTDDIQQGTLGTTIVKGFSIKNDQGKTWLQINNSATGEIGQKADTLGDTLSFTLPDKGITLSAQGQIIGGASDHYAQLSKKLSDNSSVALGYGSQYIGMPDRLSLTLNTSFTLAQLWQAVADHSAKELKGGETLAPFNKEMTDDFGADAAKSGSPTVAALSQVYAQDVARKLISQDIGTLTSDIEDLRKAGAFMDNTRTRGMVGFTSGAVDNTTADLAVGGGPTVGTYTQMTLTKTQKRLIDDKSVSLYRDGLRLQDRLIDITKQWQGDVVALAEAQWDVRLAAEEVRNAPSDAVRAEANVRLTEAQDRLHQALLSYNALTGRDATSPSPFASLSASDLQQLMASIQSLIAAPDRLTKLLGTLDPTELKTRLGSNPFNLMDWLPWVDRLAVGFGVQYQDMMNNQVLTAGVSLRLPIYDPSSKAADKAYAIEAKATNLEIEQVYAQRDLQRQSDVDRAAAWSAAARAVAPQAPDAAARLRDAIRAYRNGLIGQDEMRLAFDSWRWYQQSTLEAGAQASLASAAAAIEAPAAPGAPALPSDPARVTSFDDAYALATRNSRSLAEVADRAMAAESMARAQEHRIQKAWLDLNVGVGFTDSGLGWIPQIEITGIPVTPIFGFQFSPEELRELQVTQHDQQKSYYDALQTSLKTGLAVQFYQEVVAYRTAAADVALYDQQILPRLQSGAGDARRLDEARIGRQSAVSARDVALAQLNFLLGRQPGAPLDVAMDAGQALASLQALVAAQDPVRTQERVLDSRVAVARAVEEMVDKNLKVQTLQLEPVSVVVRAFTRLIGAFGDGPNYDPDKAAAARINTLTEERARDAYDAQRADQALRLRQRLTAAQKELAGLSDPLDAVKANDLNGEIQTLRAGLIALGEAPDGAAPAPAAQTQPPTSWTELQGRLRQAQQALAPTPPTAPPDIPAPDSDAQNLGGAYARYDYAKQTLGEDPINKGYLEGWIEVRLRDPRTPADVLVSLSRLRDEKADRVYKTQLAGAAVDADVLAAQFEADVRLLRWARASGGAAANEGFLNDLQSRADGEAARIASLLGTSASPASLEALVQEGPTGASGLADLGTQMIREIDDRQIELVRQTLFSDGGSLPDSFGSEDGFMQQIRANTLSERMSYKGFTPVLAAGMFQGTPIQGAFLEAPDPRDIQRGLESVMSDALRKQMESDGRMQALSLHLNRLMSQVADGEKELEARRAQIDAAEADLRARTALASDPGGLAAVEAAQQRLAQSWSDFGRTMVGTKSAFIELVSELSALGQNSVGTLRPLAGPAAPPAAPALPARPDAANALVDFWTEHMGDAGFAAAQDAELARLGPVVPAEARARLAAAAKLYQEALQDAEGVRENDFTDAERLDLLTRNDAEGKRLTVRDDVLEIVRDLGGLDPHSSPAAADLLAFFRGQADAAAQAGELDLATRREIVAKMNEGFWSVPGLPAQAEAEFRAVAAKRQALDDAQDALTADYLSSAGDKPTDFVLTDMRLDAYLKAEKDFDESLARALESEPFKKDPELARILDGMYDTRAELLADDSRAAETAHYGRGMAALEALIMLEKTRLNGARWSGRSPQEIDQDAQALQSLVDTRQRWLAARTDDLQPVYAVTLAGADGARTWSVDKWLTPQTHQAWLDDGTITVRDGREFIDAGKLVVMVDGRPQVVPGVHEVIGGVDAARAAETAARKGVDGNAADQALYAAMQGSPFVLAGVDGDGRPTYEGADFDSVYGPKDSLAATGRLFYFAAADPQNPGAAQNALSPLTALALPPEQVVVMAYRGAGDPPGRDRFPTLQSLAGSDAAASFRELKASPSGAVLLAAAARNAERGQLRRGWVEVKLDSFGFARDASGRIAQLYSSRDDFQAQWKAFDNAGRDLDAAQRALAAAKAEEDAAKAADAQAQTDYEAASAKLAAARAAAKPAQDQARQAADAEKATPDGVDATQRSGFSDAVHRAQTSPGLVAAKQDVDPALAARKKASDRLRDAKAKRINAETALKDAQLTLAHSKAWTLYRASDLSLSLDAAGDVVRAAAPPARGALALDSAVDGGGPAASTLTGTVAAVVVDGEGRIVKSYATDAQVDAAAASWSLKSYTAESSAGEFDARLPDGTVSTKVRFSHYEENGRPVLLSERYLLGRVDKATSKLSTASHWAIMPYNWGNIVLEIPRGIVGAPLELLDGRNPEEQHYLGRAAMYRSEGGETDHHGFFRTALGWVDVLDLLPDPVTPYFDPSQFPDAVRLTSPLRPGEDVMLKDARDGKHDVHFGAPALTRDVAEAAEDVAAARQRTLARFNGGIEDVTLEALHGRGRPSVGPDGKVLTDDVGYPIWNNQYLASRDRVVTGDQSAVDPAVAAAANPDAPGGVEVAAAPNGLFVDRVVRRITVYPGAAGYESRAAALNGYGPRVDARAAAARDAAAGLASADAAAQAAVDARGADRDRAASEESALWARWYPLADRIGTQREVERRIAAAASEVDELRGQASAWDRYAQGLADALRLNPQIPGRPGAPGTPGHPFGLSTFWVWALALFGLGGLLSALWQAWRTRRAALAAVAAARPS